MMIDNCMPIAEKGVGDGLKNNRSALNNFPYSVFNRFCCSLSLRMLKNTLIEAAKAGAAEIQRFFNSNFKISNKEGVNNLVTEADHASEKAIIDIIKQDHPGHFILSEETGEIVMDSE